jgi:ABC-2 type transport system ATP-binding protein
MDALAVDVEGLTFAYGAAPVLQGVALQVPQGEIFGVVGADGVGKSTLLRLLIGQLEPTAGHIRLLGMAGTDPALRDAVAYMPQGFGQYLDLSVGENLRFFASLHGLSATEAGRTIADLLARTGLRGFEDRRAAQLSGGMMQKLALACALVSKPRIMFLDEPTTGVDPLSRRAFWQLLEGVRAEGVAIVCTTANMEEAERCDRVGTLEGGRFSREGAPQALIADVDATLCGVSGDEARAWRSQMADIAGVEFVYPVGRQLKVWMAGRGSLDTLRAALATRAPGLRADLLPAGLHDVTLRALALSQQEGAHVRA